MSSVESGGGFSPRPLPERYLAAGQENPFRGPSTLAEARDIFIAKATAHGLQIDAALIEKEWTAWMLPEQEKVIQYAFISDAGDFFDNELYGKQQEQLKTALNFGMNNAELTLLMAGAIKQNMLEVGSHSFAAISILLDVTAQMIHDTAADKTILPALVQLSEAGFYPEWFFTTDSSHSYKNTKQFITSQAGKALFADAARTSAFVNFCQRFGGLMDEALTIESAENLQSMSRTNFSLYVVDALSQNKERTGARLFGSTRTVESVQDALRTIGEKFNEPYIPELVKALMSGEMNDFLRDNQRKLKSGTELVDEGFFNQYLTYALYKKYPNLEVSDYSLDAKLFLLDDSPEKRAFLTATQEIFTNIDVVRQLFPLRDQLDFAWLQAIKTAFGSAWREKEILQDTNGMLVAMQTIPVEILPEIGSILEELTTVQKDDALDPEYYRPRTIVLSGNLLNILYLVQRNKLAADIFREQYRFHLDLSTITLFAQFTELPHREQLFMTMNTLSSAIPDFALSKDMLDRLLHMSPQRAEELYQQRDALYALLSGIPKGNLARRGLYDRHTDILFELIAAENLAETIEAMQQQFGILIKPLDQISLSEGAHAFSNYPVEGIGDSTWLQLSSEDLAGYISDEKLRNALVAGEITSVPFGKLTKQGAEAVFRDYLRRMTELSRNGTVLREVTERNIEFAQNHMLLTPNVLAGWYAHLTDVRVARSLFAYGLRPPEAVQPLNRRWDNEFVAHVSLAALGTAVTLEELTAHALPKGFLENFGPAGMFLLFNRNGSSWEPGKINLNERHPLMLGGLPATEISAIILRDGNQVGLLKTEMAKRGLYIPVYDLQGKLLLLPKDFLDERKKYDIHAAIYGSDVNPDSILEVFSRLLPQAADDFAGPNGSNPETLGVHTLGVMHRLQELALLLPTAISLNDIVFAGLLHDVGKPVADGYATQAEANSLVAAGYLESLRREAGLEISEQKQQMLIALINHDIMGDLMKKTVTMTARYTPDEVTNAVTFSAEKIHELFAAIQQTGNTTITVQDVVKFLLIYYLADASSYEFIRQQLFTKNLRYNARAWGQVQKLLNEFGIGEEEVAGLHN